jgi:hypothetical protein
MKIDRKLNLVLPIIRDDGTQFFVHSTPISNDVFQQYWEIAGQTMNALYSRGFGMFAPRYACMMLLKIAKENGGTDPKRQAEEVQRVEQGFLAELHQRTNVFALGEKGWELRAFDEAKSSGLIDDDEAAEIDNAVVFFTLASRSHLKSQMEEVRGALSLWKARTELLDCTAFRKSLPTSTVGASTGETATPS